MTFGTNASAADATVIAQGSSVNKGGAVVFSDDSTAANATLIAYAGTGSGFGGGFSFSGRSTGGTMRVILFGDGTASTRNGVFGVPGQRSGVRNVSIGSIEGGGQLGLGADKMTGPNVTIGTNNLSTTFDGMISGGAQNSLTKVGIGTLTLTNGANTYSGGTNVNQGTLVVSNTSGFGAGGPIQVNTGTLGGSGTVLGPVTIAGRGAFLAPAHGTNQLATFTIQNPLTLKSGANYKYGIKANGNRIQADKVVAGGVTIESGATFSLRATIQGEPAPGTTLVAISNTSAAPIAGSFTNLPDGGLITAGGTTFRADYEGGDGNDLTLTVQ